MDEGWFFLLTILQYSNIFLNWHVAKNAEPRLTTPIDM